MLTDEQLEDLATLHIAPQIDAMAGEEGDTLDLLPLMRAVEAASTAALRNDLEKEQLRLAACGVVALANTPESAAKARQMHPDYRSAACDDVARMVDGQMQFRAALVNLRAGMAEAKNTNIVDYIDAVLASA